MLVVKMLNHNVDSVGNDIVEVLKNTILNRGTAEALQLWILLKKGKYFR